MEKNTYTVRGGGIEITLLGVVAERHCNILPTNQLVHRTSFVIVIYF